MHTVQEANFTDHLNFMGIRRIVTYAHPGYKQRSKFFQRRDLEVPRADGEETLVSS